MASLDFFEQVHQVVKLIPRGRVTSYGAIAHYLGLKRGARVVGWALQVLHAYPDIPAHRVLNRLGQLTGMHHFSPPNSMQTLLEDEGFIVKDNALKDFEKYFWNPSIELDM